jgi:hypothetical protein
MRHFVLTVSLSAAILIAGALVPDRGGFARISAPAPVDCCDSRA